jgi:hypothetical protein
MYDNFTGDLSTGEINSYMQTIRQELESKNSIFKSCLMLQTLSDGTARNGTPAGLGKNNTSSGASFTLDDNVSPLRVKLSTDPAAAGAAAWFTEGQVISFVYEDRDLNNDGVNEAASGAGKIRFLSLRFDDAGAGTATQYDAFTVVAIHQSSNIIELWPVRVATATPTQNNGYNQFESWVPGGTGAVTVTPFRGRTIDGQTAAIDTVFGLQIADINLVIGAAITDQYQTLIHPEYIHTTQAEAKLQLGQGWTSSTEMSSLCKYVPTGLHTLLCDRTHTVHGINRSSVLMNLPTYISNYGAELTFNSFLRALTDHTTRNRKALPDWNVMLMNSLVKSSLISLSESSRMIQTGDGVRGKPNKQFMNVNGKMFQFEDSSCMRADKVYAIADGTMHLYDGQLKPVSIGGVSIFPALVDGERTDVSMKHSNLTCEMVVKGARKNLVIDDFKITALN